MNVLMTLKQNEDSIEFIYWIGILSLPVTVFEFECDEPKTLYFAYFLYFYMQAFKLLFRLHTFRNICNFDMNMHLN